MCDIDDDGEEAELCREAEVTSWRVFICCECQMPIPKGRRYTRITMLYDGQWSTYRSHSACIELVRYIAFTVCEQRTVYIGYIPLRERVREHQEHLAVLLMWRDILRARRAEGVWPVRKTA